MTIKIEIGIIDINGFVWNFDGCRVYLVDAEDEMESGENGYPCNNITDARNLVIDSTGGIKDESAETKLKHISTIKGGDTILHNGIIMTVCEKDITSGFEGVAVFGDSYRGGAKLVKVVQIPHKF